MTNIIWPRVFAWWAVILAFLAMVVSFQMVGCTPSHAEELPIAVQTIIGECANCSDEGMIAVANVIRNRAKTRNQSVEAVCLAKWQFSCWNDKSWLVGHLKRNKWVTARAWSAWQASRTEDLTGGADHYFADYIKRPRWASGMDFMVKVGRHSFYKA